MKTHLIRENWLLFYAEVRFLITSTAHSSSRNHFVSIIEKNFLCAMRCKVLHYTTTEGQAILFPFLRVQSSSYCKWRDILYIVHNTKCSLSVIYYFLDVEMLLLWLRLRRETTIYKKNIVKIFRVLLYANALFCLWSPSCNFLARWLWLHEIGVWGLKNEYREDKFCIQTQPTDEQTCVCCLLYCSMRDNKLTSLLHKTRQLT